MHSKEILNTEDYLLINKDGRFRVGRINPIGDAWQLSIYTDHKAARWPLDQVVSATPLSPSSDTLSKSLDKESSRQKFEDFAKKERGLDTTRLPHGDYRSFATGEAWAAWVASSANADKI